MDDLVKRLRLVDACAVSDALDSLGVRGVAHGLSRLSTRRRVAGRVRTVKLEAANGTASPRHLGTAAVDASGPGQVIVVAHGGRTDVAGWGGILSLAGATRGIEGVVIDGACRDIDESREVDMPVFARCAVPSTARGRVVERDWNVPIEVCGVPVEPQDYVIADGSGVVFVPRAHAPDIVARAEQIAAREQAMAAEVRKGTRVSDVMNANYESLISGLR